tara:strand:- start:316 stop:498 length:183 start_codon:yes stop_codon:yes gene_type:complete
MQLAENRREAQAKLWWFSNKANRKLPHPASEHITYTLLGAVILEKQSLKAKDQKRKKANK